MCNKTFAVAGISLSQLKIVYFLTGIVFIMMAANYVLALVIPQAAGGSVVSNGNVFMMLPIFAAIFIPAEHTRKMLHLGAKRHDFFLGAVPVYALLCAVSSLVMFFFYYTIDKMMLTHLDEVLDVMVAFRFITRGPVVAFVQMFAFMMLFSAFVHTLTAAQDKWYGWVADFMVIAIISVFTPIAPLRASLVWFFNLIIFHSNAWLQIIACLVLASLIYMLNRLIIARKVI